MEPTTPLKTPIREPTTVDSIFRAIDKKFEKFSFKLPKSKQPHVGHSTTQTTAKVQYKDKITHPTSNASSKAIGKRLSYPSTSSSTATSKLNDNDISYMGTKKIPNPLAQTSSQRHTINEMTEKRRSKTDSAPLTASITPKNNDKLLSEDYVPNKIFNPSAQTNIQKRVTVPALHDDFYKMDHDYRGRVVIFSHTNFTDDLESREGSEKDVDNLKKHLPRLGYLGKDISVYRDFTFSDIAKTLGELSSKDFSDYDTLMLFVLTHGDNNDKIYARDTEYSVEKLWKPFLGERCPSLVGKPKLFFVIACRGNNTDPGVKVINKRKLSTSTDAADINDRQSYTIPIHADILTVHSTTPGYFSYREDWRGTWYIDVFCQELSKLQQKEKIDFIDFLTRVNLKLSTAKTTYNPEDLLMDKKKQCSSFTSTLLRKITM